GSGGCTVTMTANQSVTATFAVQAFALTVSPAPSNGTVTGLGIGCPGACRESVASGGGGALVARAAARAPRRQRGGFPCGGGGRTVQMTQTRTVPATFTPIAYTLTVSPAPSNGTISGPGISCGTAAGDCAESVASGTSVALTASAAAGYQLGVWSGCQSVSG